MLARIDERTQNTAARVESLDHKVDRLSDSIGTNYVSREEFAPVKIAVYGLVALLLTATIAAIMRLVLTQ